MTYCGGHPLYKDGEEVHRFFLIYGIVILTLFAYAQFRGLSLTSYDEIKSVPKSVRQNPGAYRSVYQRYSGK